MSSRFEKGVVSVTDILSELEKMKVVKLAEALDLMKNADFGPKAQSLIAECYALSKVETLVNELACFEVSSEIRNIEA